MPDLANVKPEDRIIGRYPDEHGHFGPYGGTFIAETLVRPVSELRDAYERYSNDSRVPRGARRGAQALCGQTFAALLRAPVVADHWRRPHVPEARGI